MTRQTGADAQMVIAKAMSEKALSDNIVSLARMLGWLVHRDPTWRATGADAGYPDLTLIRTGTIIFAELKTVKGVYGDKQWNWATEIASVQHRTDAVKYYLWRPSDWLDGTIEKVLR